ncbi:DUF2026 family protein [Grimontia marina]|uniref:DUF2026 domain-containing protein n=1 Tax=Grimontia marina TaxID=646534 RepID=A0A128EYN8_9GAMM|nr:DUF2026 family protein [Grimontia marina]CZF79693.1 hypothetical protein GMA8713_01088 [Grimontia marina]
MKYDITLKQYELIYKIVASVGREFSAGPGKSCQLYNVFGALILSELFKVKAKPVMGAAFIRLNESGDTLSFAVEKEGRFYSGLDAFHCWVETENNIIDFTAPEYREALAQAGIATKIQRNMLQKEKSSVCASIYDMANVGDIYFEANPNLTGFLLQDVLVTPAIQDLAGVCIEWHKKGKKKLSKLEIINDLYEVTTLTPINHKVVGAW